MAEKKRPQIQRREVWISLPDEYEGFELRIWINAPAKHWAEINSGSEERALAALQHVVLEHNGWLNFDGEEFPPCSHPAFWDEIPTELAACVLAATQVRMGELAKSLVPTRRRR